MNWLEKSSTTRPLLVSFPVASCRSSVNSLRATLLHAWRLAELIENDGGMESHARGADAPAQWMYEKLLSGGSNAARREGPPRAAAVAVGQRREESRLDPPYAAPMTCSDSS